MTNNVYDESLESSDEQVEEIKLQRAMRTKIIAIASVLCLIAVSGIGYLVYSSDFFESMRVKEYEKQKKIESSIEIVNFMPMIVALDSAKEGVNTFMKVDIGFEVLGPRGARAIEANKEKIIDIIHEYLSGLRKEDMQGTYGLYRLRREIMLRINTVISPMKVESVLLKDLIIQ